MLLLIYFYLTDIALQEKNKSRVWSVSSSDMILLLGKLRCYPQLIAVNEEFVYSYKLRVESQFAQEKYHIIGGETPDPRFVLLLQRYIREIEIYQEQHKGGYPDWAVRLMKDRYGIKLYNC